MKIKAGVIWEAVPIIAEIIQQRRPMPQAGKFRLARMHQKLFPEFQLISGQRDELIKAYDVHAKIPNPAYGSNPEDPLAQKTVVPEFIDGPEFTVPEGKMPEFSANWEKLCNEEIEIDLLPIPINMLSPANAQNGSIEANEIAQLGGLITDLSEVQA